MTTVRDIFECIEKLESLKKQATTERSHFYVDATSTEAIALLYEFARTFKETK
jgi:hypothetical protein